MLSNDAYRTLRSSVDEDFLSVQAAVELARSLKDDLIFDALLEAALESKIRGKGRTVSVSKNVFIPLTNHCRDR